MEILRTENVSFAYPESQKKALRDVSLQVNQGDFVILWGKSGCGKTTLLKLIKKEIAPHGQRQGEIFYKGTNQAELNDKTGAFQIGYVMQDADSQTVTNTVWHELAFGLENTGTAPQTIRLKTGEIANYFGIQNWFRSDTAQLSGGQKQLVNLASVMVTAPDLLLLDEPTSKLDPIAAENFMNILQKINKELGTTILIATHNLEEVFDIATKVVVMEQGGVILQEPPERLAVKLSAKPNYKHLLQGMPSSVKIHSALAPYLPEKVASAPVLTNSECKTFLNTYFYSGTEPVCKDTNQKAEYKRLNQDPILTFANVWFRYQRDSADILRGVNVSVSKGEVLSVLGGNGSGKTTLLHTMAGILPPYKGKITVKGRQVKQFKNRELYIKNLALLPQNVKTLFVKDTLLADYKDILKTVNCPKHQWDSKIQQVAEQLDIVHLLQKHPYDVSGGEQQKCAIAKILLLEPEIILMDEPTKGLDAYAKETVGKMIRSLQAGGKTIILVTHDIDFAARVSDRCALFFDGEIMAQNTPMAFFSGNRFYTTSAIKIAGGMYDNILLWEDIVPMAKQHRKGAET